MKALWDVLKTKMQGYKQILKDQHAGLYGVCNKNVKTATKHQGNLILLCKNETLNFDIITLYLLYLNLVILCNKKYFVILNNINW